MKTIRGHWGWHLLLSCAVVGGAIACSCNSTLAQVIQDGTLGTVVMPGGCINCTITGGTLVGGVNLFHSFKQFSVPTGGSAYFNFSNGPNIQNIFSLVTGGTVSKIHGLIRANGNANLFLINPSGIIFGHNASLSIGGSFVASTATGLKLADGTLLSATNLQAPPLLKLSVPVGLQYGATIGSIINRSKATDSNGLPVGLQVQPGKTLALVGGEVKLNGGILQAPGGRVELGGVAAAGTVGLNLDNSSPQLSFPDGVARTNVSLGNRAQVNVRAGGGGSIVINAQNLKIAGASQLLAGIASGSGSPDSKAGNIEINATEAVTLSGTGSLIANQVQANATGKGGDIDITAGTLKVTGGFQILASTNGYGDAGSVNIFASDRASFDGEGADTSSSGAYSIVGTQGVGNGGNVNITAGSLSLTGGAALQALTYGKGDAGSVNISVRDNVSFDGEGADFFSSGAYSDVEQGAGPGNAGTVNLTSGSLSVTKGAVVQTNTYGQGNAGNVTINVLGQTLFDGEGNFNGTFRQSSGAFSDVLGTGNGGSVNLTTGSLSLTNGAALESSTYGTGNAGNVNIAVRDRASFDGEGADSYSSGARSDVEQGAVGNGGIVNLTSGSLSLTNGGVLEANTFGQGNAGNVNIGVLGQTLFDGEGAADSFSSGARSDVEQGAVGNGGTVNLTSGSLSLTNGGVLEANTFGQGNAGNVNIGVLGQTLFDGEGAADHFSSGARSDVVKGAMGNGGNVNLTSGSLSLTNGAVLEATTFGQGNAGNVNIAVRDRASFDGEGADYFSSGVYSRVEKHAVGNGGKVKVTAGSLYLSNGAVVTTSTDGQGNAGSVTINADTVSFDGESSDGRGFIQSSGAFSAVKDNGVGHGGNVEITAGAIEETNGAAIITNTLGNGDAGNIYIFARGQIAFDGVGADLFRSGAYSQVTSSGVGHGGSVNVTAESFSVTNGAALTVSTFGQGNAGNVKINVQQLSSFDGVGINGLPSGVFSTVQLGAVGNGGDINVTTGAASITKGAELAANTFGQGNAGSVTITAKDAVVLDGVANQGFSSGLFSGTEPKASGQGSKIKIQAGALQVSNGAVLSARTLNNKSGANIIVDTNTLEVMSGGQLLTTAFRSGKAGDITVNASNVTISGTDPTFDARLRQFDRSIVDPASAASGLFANTDRNSAGQGGSINIHTGQILVQDGGQVSTSSQGSGAAGNLDITASSIRLDNKASLNADTTAGQGNINLYSKNLILRHGSDITTNATGTATGGNITINTDNLVAIPQEDSDISANAQDSFGGRVVINAKGIFGIQFRPQDTPLSDITATSQLGPQFNGTVQLNTPGIDPSHGLQNLPARPVEPKVAQVCQVGASENQSQFVLTGRGGLPPNPQDTLSPDAVYVDWVTLKPTAENRYTQVPKEQTNTTGVPLVEAQGWVMNNKGQVVLVAQAPILTPHSSWHKSSGCSVPRSTLKK